MSDGGEHMALMITKRTVETRDGGWRRETTERVPLTVPTEWAMFSSAGNRSLTKKAEILLRKVEGLVEARKATRKNVNAALVAFVAGWERMSYSKGFGEAGDTAVRECVGDFHDRVYDAVFGSGSAGYDTWEKNRDAAYARVRTQRGR
jgi:hypothetical protein